MDTAQQYSNLVYHLPHLPPHAISSSATRQSLAQDMSWQPTQHSPLSASTSASSVHVQTPHTMSHSQNHVDYATPSAQQLSYIPHHIPDPSVTIPSPSAVDPGPSAQSLSFDSPQVESSIGPDRGLSRRRLRMHERVPSHGELPEYGSMSQSYGHPPPNYQFPPSHGSRPHSPVPQAVYQLSEHTQPSTSNPDAYTQRVDGQPRSEWRLYPQAQSRSASGSAASASSNPRSASPALSVASALTSVSSASNSQLFTVESPVRKAPALTARRDRKKRLYNIDRYKICIAAQENPGMKQEDIAAIFDVERSTVSKILKQKARWLSVSPTEKVLVAKLRPSKFPLLEGRLEDWVKNASKAGKVLTDQLLRKKAREFGDAMGFTQDKFKASSGWLENFKHRHGIRRGVWYGNGTLDQKYRAYASDFVPDQPQAIVPFPGTPPPIREDRGYNDPIDTDDEDDGQAQGAVQNENIPPTDAPMFTLRMAPGQDPSAKPTEPAGARAPFVHSYDSQDNLTFGAYDGTTAVALEPGSAEMQTGAAADDVREDNMALLQYPAVVEVVPPVEVMDDREAEHCVQKLLVYLKARQDELNVEPEVWANMFHIQSKIFGKISGRPYDQPQLNLGISRTTAS